MNIGFLSNCLDMNLEKKIIAAYELRCDDIEIFCSESKDSDLRIDKVSREYLEKIKIQLFHNNINVSSLALYRNMLSENKSEKKYIEELLYKLVDTADILGVNIVSTFIGKDVNLSTEENFDLFEDIFKPAVYYADRKNIKIAIENCSMPSWHPQGYPSTISYSPEFWDEMFKRIPSKNFGLNFDPSHLIWQQIDYLAALEKYSERIFNIHLNEIKLDKDNLKRYGIFGKQLEREHKYDFGWYNSVTIGSGDIDWRYIIKLLIELNYKGSLTIEFKDKNHKNNLSILTGLKQSKEYINNIIEGEYNNVKI